MSITSLILNFLKSDLKTIILISIIFSQSYYILKKTFSMPKKNPSNVCLKGNKNLLNNILTVYVFKGSGSTISSSPFTTKILTFLRLCGIPHNVKEADMQKAPKGKVPYLVHGENIVGDSQLMIRYLENTFDLNEMSKILFNSKEYNNLLTKQFIPFSNLTKQQQAQSDMIRLMCEGELYWGLVSIRWFGTQGIGRSEVLWKNTMKSYFSAIPAFIRPILCAMIRTQLFGDAWGQGLIRHSPDDQIYFIKRDLNALSTILSSNNNKFMLGDFPTEVDCIVFGTIEPLSDDSLWPNEISNFIKTSCPNLIQYCKNLRNNLFMDMTPGMFLAPSKINYKAIANDKIL